MIKYDHEVMKHTFKLCRVTNCSPVHRTMESCCRVTNSRTPLCDEQDSILCEILVISGRSMTKLAFADWASCDCVSCPPPLYRYPSSSS